MRTGTQIALLSIDLEMFKRVNDTRGHAVGDELIRVALRLLASIRQDDLVVRIGGDECLVAPNRVHNLGEAVRPASKMLADLCPPCEVAGRELEFTASVGAALLGFDKAPDNALRRADVAMYQAKSSGRNCVVAAGAP